MFLELISGLTKKILFAYVSLLRRIKVGRTQIVFDQKRVANTQKHSLIRINLCICVFGSAPVLEHSRFTQTQKPFFLCQDL